METLINELIMISNDIYNSIGPGYNEVIYHRAFEVALRLKGVPYESEVVTPIVYQNHTIGHGRIDLIVNKMVIIELKAIANLNNNDSIIQIKNYMRQNSVVHGLIINFGQSNSKTPATITIKYINTDRIFNFVDNHFQELIV